MRTNLCHHLVRPCTFRRSFSSLSLATLRNSARPSSCSSIAEFSKACSCSGSNSNALSKYAKAWDAFPCSRNTTPSCESFNRAQSSNTSFFLTLFFGLAVLYASRLRYSATTVRCSRYSRCLDYCCRKTALARKPPGLPSCDSI